MRTRGICFIFIIFLNVFFLLGEMGWGQGNFSEKMNRIFSGGQKRTKTIESYSIPNVVLINQDGSKVSLPALLNSEKPVLLDFMFVTCNTICPVLSSSFASFQRKLGPEAASVQLVSITIDPENDTSDVLKEYSVRYEAGPGWEFLTGSRDDIDRVMKAFNAYVTNKMSHFPLTLLHSAGGDKWVRIDGLMSGAALMDEYRTLLEN